MHTVIYPYGVALADWLADQQIDPSQIAAVFIEPHRWQPTRTGWLQDVRLFCKAAGIVLVFDEMIYGGRWALGGASEFFDVQPDLACYGKALGNGAAIAAVVGPASLLEDHGSMVSGTFSGDTVGLAAFIDTVQFYTDFSVIDTLWERGARLAEGLARSCAAFPALKAEVQGAAPVHLRVTFGDPSMGQRFAKQMMLRDVLVHPDCWNVSYSHTDAIIKQVVQAADDAMYALVKEGA